MSTGYIHSIQSLGTVDGPGVRFVAFLQGCHLRCKCCHNPDTWAMNGGRETDADELVKKAARYREYFGETGGVTLSGGEPLLQPQFAYDVFRLCHENGLTTCLDTAGVPLSDAVKAVLTETDRVLLDVKFTTEDGYRDNVGGRLQTTLDFLAYLDEHGVPTTVRQVIIPTVNDTVDNVERLKRIADAHACVDKVELLPFRKICQTKYDNMGLEFPFGHLPEASAKLIHELNALL